MKRLPRKLKKGLKKAILKDVDPAWKSKDVVIGRVERHFIWSKRNPTYKGMTVMSYKLGIAS